MKFKISFLISTQILMKLQKTLKKFCFLAQIQTRLCWSAYLAGSANVNFCKSHSVYKLLFKEKEKDLTREISYTLWTQRWMECDMLTCDIRAFLMKKLLVTFSSSKCTEAGNGIFKNIMKWEGDGFLRHGCVQVGS